MSQIATIPTQELQTTEDRLPSPPCRCRHRWSALPNIRCDELVTSDDAPPRLRCSPDEGWNRAKVVRVKIPGWPHSRPKALWE